MSDQPKMQVLPDGSKEWLLNGKLHREDGPAREDADGTKNWCLNGKLHRIDGPAIEWADGSKEWRLNGKFHRTDGPAIEWISTAGVTKKWYLNGTKVSWQEVFKKASNLEIELRILIAALTTS
jgi:hypothetical protein